ncbi:MAG: efflux RND transporter periplasmic adaptor subunit [Candidatus Cloacimonetes bacterium]|nr:efflux RND transporter periplasmic adaptor subunit [Candidatus Cloacimonadota bacterium]
MKKKAVIMTIILLLISVILLLIFRKKDQDSVFVFTGLEQSTIELTVSCTGTLEAKGTVEVGSQLSGSVKHVLADFNEDVEVDQVLAILDTTKLVLETNSARADLIRTQSQYDLSIVKYEDNLELYQQGYISELDLKTSETELRQSEAALISAQNNLEKAQLNLKSYAVIRSPIKGKIIDRSIESGQTIAASLSAPVLFTIAEDLSQMEIHALVDESDIGLVKENQSARFTVETFSDKEFTGIVKEIRLVPSVISNVVNYTVIISADNKEGLLLPGMTTTLDIIVEAKDNIICLSNSALNFTPTTEMLASFRSAQQNRNKTQNPLSTQQIKRITPGTEFSRVWFLDENNNLQMAPVKTGISDGIKTEIIDQGNLIETSRIIVSQGNASVKNTSSNQFRPGPGIF